MGKKNNTDLKASIAQAIYENTTHDIGGDPLQLKLNEIVDSAIPSNNLNPGTSLAWEPATLMLFPTALSGEGETLTLVPTITAALNTIVKVNFKNKTYTYQLQAETYETEEPNYIRPADYSGVTNKKVWILLNERIKTFTSADLDDGKLTYEHGLNYEILMFQILDPNGIYLPASQQFKKINNKIIEIDFGGAIEAGTHTLLIKI